MTNLGIQYVKTADVNHFTSDFGIAFRQQINRPLRAILRIATKRKIVVESYPQLEKNKPYIFASTHSFDEDIIVGLGCIDRPAYVLMGTTDQIEHNPQVYAAWANGMIYVNRLDSQSRKDAALKMERILHAGSSILIFPEGGWNNTENLLCNPLFAGPYLLAQRTGAQIVPICSFCEHCGDTVYFNAASPLNAEGRSKEEVLAELRDTMATMMFQSIEQHTKPISRAELPEDFHIQFMAERCREYQRVKWSRDTWEEELTVYHNRQKPTPKMIRDSLRNVVLSKENGMIMAPILVRIAQDDQYDFKQYMHNNWNRKHLHNGLFPQTPIGKVDFSALEKLAQEAGR